MALENRLGSTAWAELAREEERIRKKRAVERSPIRDIERKHVLRAALTDAVNDRMVYRKGLDTSYFYEGYMVYRAENL